MMIKQTYLNVVLKSCLGFLICILFISQANAQDIKAELDTANIRIGEQLKYTISIDSLTKDDQVVFPKDQSFIPLEMVESLPTDTSSNRNNFISLIKSYKLTQFDSGQYTIPPQLLKINNQAYLTDSIKVEVASVKVDTAQQKLFPIKREINVSKPFQMPTWIWWFMAIAVILVISFLLYFKYKKQNDEAKKRIPPFEKAKQELKQLDDKKWLENRQLKAYISELTNISRRYLDEKIEVPAMEYTTGELMQALIKKRDDKHVLFKEKYLDNYNAILVDADLAKFAGHRPDVISLKTYRKDILKFIKHVQSAIPQPTASELEKDERYQALLKRKRKRQKWLIGGLLSLVILVGAATAVVATKGFDYVKDAVFGNETKTLLEGDWITSEYAFPPIKITTPEVLVRQNPDSLGIKSNNNLESEIFASGSLYSELYIVLSQVKFQDKSNFDLDQAVDGVYDNLETKGAYNILMKSEDFETIEGIKGVKVSGSFAIENPITSNDIKKSYQILNFGYAGNYQQITIIFNDGDTYAETITNRLINSVEFEKPNANAQ